VVWRGAGGRRSVFAGYNDDRDLVASQLIKRVLQRLDKFVVDKFFFKLHRGVQNQTVVRKGNNRCIVEPGRKAGRREIALKAFERHLQYIVGHGAPPVDMDTYYNSISYPQIQRNLLIKDRR